MASSKSLTIHYSLIIILLGSVFSELLITSLNKPSTGDIKVRGGNLSATFCLKIKPKTSSYLACRMVGLRNHDALSLLLPNI
jgi:hypothetical protein